MPMSQVNQGDKMNCKHVLNFFFGFIKCSFIDITKQWQKLEKIILKASLQYEFSLVCVSDLFLVCIMKYTCNVVLFSSCAPCAKYSFSFLLVPSLL